MVLNFVECVLMVVSLKEKFLLNYIYFYMNDIFKKKLFLYVLVYVNELLII